MNTELIKPVVPMVPKYYYVVDTDRHPESEYPYFGRIISRHRSLSAAFKAETLGKSCGMNAAVYGADFLINDSDFLSQLYGGAAPEWRSPVLMASLADAEEGK